MTPAAARQVAVVVVGAAQSGAGKTTATLALIAALRRRGLRVQPFKVGPDYLDPALLGWAAGRPCRNLDTHLVPPPHLLELFRRACRGADVAVVEGVMGLFDGRSGPGDEASTAAVARLLGAGVLLVLDAARSARTVGAVGLGLAGCDPRLRTVGVILNRVSGERHLATCRAGLASARLACLGHLERQPALALPDRYLGLVSPAESEPPPGLRRCLERASSGWDLDAILAGAAEVAPEPGHLAEASLFPPRPLAPEVRIGLARDRAFHFYYQDSLDLLEAWGAELVPFSPLADSRLPQIDAVILGGGYPELFAPDLAANHALLASLRAAHGRGVRVYAECGGAMYAGAGIQTADGGRHHLAALWPGWTSLRRRALTVGYRRVRSLVPGFLDGRDLPAHEFHHSLPQVSRRRLEPAWQVLDGGGATGWVRGGLFASYLHLHLGSEPGLAAAFVAACRPLADPR